ncbi:MAG: isoprenylcysteine carboxylmethyltransferase family protein [bacterium]
MKRQKSDFLIQRYQLEHLVPLALAILSFYFWANNFQKDWVYFSGLFVSMAGLIIWWAAKITLGKDWDAGYGEPKIKNLVTRGIYSKISHPLYWGINLTLIGLSLVHLNIFLIILSLMIVIYFFRRMSVEDRFLSKELGEKYLEYKRKTWI